jgi:hypothetical protein
VFRAVAHDAADLAHSYLRAIAREERPTFAGKPIGACGQHGSAHGSFFLGANEGNRAQEKNQGRALSRMASKRRRRTGRGRADDTRYAYALRGSLVRPC